MQPETREAEADGNQPPPFVDIDLYSSDRALQDAVAKAAPAVDLAALGRFGAEWGSAARFDDGRLANENPPRLRLYDGRGERIDRVEFHPAYHALMAASTAAGLARLGSGPEAQSQRAARLFIAYQVEAGHICPMTMTHAAQAALAAEPALMGRWLPKLVAEAYDPAPKPWWEKTAVTLGMGMTERQGGTDVRANTTRAVEHGDHYEINGGKWFMSAPMSDGFLVLAQAEGGLTCFLMPRFRPDGSLNALHFRRLKDKLGNRSNASAEVDFVDAFAERVGAEGQGIRTIMEMVGLTRLDCAVASAALMRFGLAHTVHHTRSRRAFGRPLLGQPAMRSVVADLALESEAMTALVFRLARAYDSARADPAEALFARLMTPAIKYLVCKIAPAFLYEAMECHGGNGYVEELPLARAYREAPVNAIWEGSGNVVALDVLRVAARRRDEVAELIDRLEREAGLAGRERPVDAKALLFGNDAERTIRLAAEYLARLAALAPLRAAHPALAEAYVATRFGGRPQATWGACDLGSVEDLLIERSFSAGI